MKAALYARVSTFDQEPENQLQELRRYAAARRSNAAGLIWPSVE
jgi:DNA invertase Pin-like site-specific DNA recombinase